MKSDTLLPFEKKVLYSLWACGISADSVSENSPLGVAVSGGADSVSLLVSLSKIFSARSLRVISVDHGIRAEAESGGDACFVRDLCERICVPCVVKKIEQGKILSVAKNGGESVEAVARNLRYEFFDLFVREENLCALALAHNQNDQVETLLMRFLQGSADGMGGIRRIRGKYIRPLLDIPRCEIEAYLRENGQPWRTDSTNCDTTYLRNKVRSVLVPILNEQFVSWQKSVLSGAKKAQADEEFIGSCVPSVTVPSVDRAFFYSLHDAVKRRVFFDLLNKSGFGSRFPFALFEEIVSWEHEKSREISFENVKISLDEHFLTVSVHEENSFDFATTFECGFSFLFKKIGDEARIGNLLVRAESAEKIGTARLVIRGIASAEKIPSFDKEISVFVLLPFLVRSALSGDFIKTADGKRKNLSDIFTDWKLPSQAREKVLVVEELAFCAQKEMSLRAVLASFLGAKNWIVEEAKL